MYQFPFKGKFRITCPFGKSGSWSAGWHIGSDLVGDDDQHIYPIGEGIVESISAHGKAYGQHVCIKHTDGNVSLYAHMCSINVRNGQTVGLDTCLGMMGATGNANGKHLHLELHRNKYKYPAKDSSPTTAAWLINPVEWIENHSEKVSKVEEWQLVAIKEVCAKYGMDVSLWLDKATEPVTIGELFGILNKVS